VLAMPMTAVTHNQLLISALDIDLAG
jgi:hypothetical protein